jgi:hypothetical protein
MPLVGGGMGVAKPFDAFSADFESSLTKKLVGEQASANLSMDAPDRQFDPLRIERLLPGKDVLIHAVNERAVEIKQEEMRMLSFPAQKRPSSSTQIGLCQFNHLIAATVGDRLEHVEADAFGLFELDLRR